MRTLFVAAVAVLVVIGNRWMALPQNIDPGRGGRVRTIAATQLCIKQLRVFAVQFINACLETFCCLNYVLIKVIWVFFVRGSDFKRSGT